ncbi:MAG: hypothetical protein M1834_009320 [Cirrosporium novae-zelandiae]|nr:MAG: hypothetical protein M1834_009320 [Cirrosporium novae-zelandiae]
MTVKKLKIVCLDGCYLPVPRPDVVHEYTEYPNTKPSEVLSRAKNANIIITTKVPLTAETINACAPLGLEMIAMMAAGTENVDKEACHKNHVLVTNVPSASAESVAEHAIALYLARKRRIVELDAMTKRGDVWNIKGTMTHHFGGPPTGLRSDVMGIIGYGGLGKRIETLARALGLSVLIADRKGARPEETREGRTSFAETIQQSTVLVLACPLNKDTRHTIGEQELRDMRKDAILINVARGAVVDELALAIALEEHQIAGAATDVFGTEPATMESSPLLQRKPPNLTVSPHIAWYATTSIEYLQDTVKGNIEAWVAGKPRNIVVE